MSFQAKPCLRCQGTTYSCIPDSLACACENCGFVWVMYGPEEKWEAGATLQEWARDLYEDKEGKEMTRTYEFDKKLQERYPKQNDRSNLL